MSFGISNNVKSRVVRICTPELFQKAVDSTLVAGVCSEIEDALEKARRGEMSKEDFETFKAERKKMLPVITPHATFKNGRRLNADAVPSGLSMYDIDHIADPEGYFARNVEARVEELRIVLVHKTPSTEGLRFFFVIPEGMDLAAAQKWMSGQLGNDNYDGSVKDLARCSFIVPRDYILYIDENGLFTDRNPLPAGLAGEGVYSAHNSEPVRDFIRAEQSPAPTVGVGDIAGCRSFKGVPYADIIAEWFALTGGEPVQGERNTRLHKLACHLRYITDNNELLLSEVMPRFGLPEEEMSGLIRSACAAKFCSDMPKVLKDAIRCAEKKRGIGGDSLKEGQNGETALPPPMPKKLPPLVRLLLSGTPDIYKPAVAHAIFPPLAAHLHRVRFRYIDNVEHEATLMNVLMAGTGAGKDCISEPINRIMADIRRQDEENLRRERAWKNEINSKGANKDKRGRPEGLVIQEIDADMTNPAFVMRTAEADGHFLYTKMNEIDQFDALRGAGRDGQQFQIICLAFDPGNRYGQTRVGTQSITEKVTIRFNWNAATTTQKGKRYFSRVLTDGPLSRINFCTIPEREIGADMPVYGFYDAAFDESLRPYIENLTRATGLVDCPGAFRLAEKLREEKAEEARLTQSRVFENFSFRANVIAYLKACVLYVAQDCRWDKTIEDFIRWSLEYDLWCKMEFFGADIEAAMRDIREGEVGRRGRRNLLEMLPETFTLADAVRVRQSQGMDAEGTANMLRQWKCRRYITIVTNDNYRKLKFRK